MSEFSGKTLYYWGILRPDGKAVTTDPLDRSSWRVDESLAIAGYPTTNLDGDSYERTTVVRGAEILTNRLIDLGVDPDAAGHAVVLFEVVTSVTASHDGFKS